MPWYSYIGFVICGLGFLPLAYDLYEQRYKKRRMSLMDAAAFVASQVRRDRLRLSFDPLFSVLHWQESRYSHEIKNILSLILEACKRAKLHLLATEGTLRERPVESSCIELERIRFVNDHPVLCDVMGQVTFKDLSLEKSEVIQWIKNSLRDESFGMPLERSFHGH